MPLFFLTFEKTIECTVEAESEEALQAVAEEMGDYELRDWASNDWEVSIRSVSKKMALTAKKADCGLVDGEILEWGDYQAALKKKKDKP